MPVTNTWGPPSIAGSVDSFVDTALGGIKDYQTGQLLESLPKTADGSVDYRAAAAKMYRTNPGLAAQFLKMDEHRSLEGYRKDTIDIMRQNAATAADKSSTIDMGDRILQTGRGGEPIRMFDKDTGTWTDLRGVKGGTPASPQVQPQTQAPREPPPEAIEILKQRPNTAAQFEKTFGLPPGGSQQYLGGGTTAPAAAPAPAPVPAAPVAPQAQPQPAQAPVTQRPPGMGYTEWQELKKRRAAELGKIEPKSIEEAEKQFNGGRKALGDMRKIQELNETAFQGPGASLRGNIAALTGIGGKQAGANTLVMENMITSQMLTLLRTTFGASPTEGERAVLAQVQGSVGQPYEVRKQIFKEAEEAIINNMKENRDILQRMRSGTYLYKGQQGGYDIPERPAK